MEIFALLVRLAQPMVITPAPGQILLFKTLASLAEESLPLEVLLMEQQLKATPLGG